MTSSLQCYSYKFHAMGGPCLFKAWANTQNEFDQWVERVTQEVSRIEKKYSVFDENSLLSEINKKSGVEAVNIDRETYELLSYADSLWQASHGKFDISSSPLFKLWDFKNEIIPSDKQLQKEQKRIGWELVELEEDKVFLSRPNMHINFGGFGKEYAVDAVIAQLKQSQCEYALLNLSGDVAVTGKQPDGEGWKIGVQHPRQLDAAIQMLTLKQGAIATSGDYERFFIKNNKRYCHIINALTGQPVDKYASISILASSCLVAGSFATLAMLEESNAPDWLQENEVAALLVDKSLELQWLNAGFFK